MVAAQFPRSLCVVAALAVFGCQSDPELDPDPVSQPDPGPAASTSPLEPAGSTETASPAPAPAPQPVRSAVVDDDGQTGSSDAYDVMCAHYCRTLEKTHVYSCLASGGDADGCFRKWAGDALFCFEIRCVPRRVDLAICRVQCDAFGRFYGDTCASPDPARQSLCPLPPAESDRVCRAGCVLPDPSTEPPVESASGTGRV